jgi:hypothetical protein
MKDWNNQIVNKENLDGLELLAAITYEDFVRMNKDDNTRMLQENQINRSYTSENASANRVLRPFGEPVVRRLYEDTLTEFQDAHAHPGFDKSSSNDERGSGRTNSDDKRDNGQSK